MKNFNFLIMSLFLSINTFAQKSDWGSWTQTSCFKGISFRVRIAENTLYSENRYKYEVEFKNNYSTNVSFSYLLSDLNSSNTLCKERIKLSSGSTKIAWSLLSTNNNTTIRVYTEKACFEENGDCGQYNKQCYANCDNGIPNIPTDCDKLANNISTENSNNQIKPSTNNSKVKPEDLVTALNKTLDEKKVILKKFFIDNGYSFINEGNYIIDYGDGEKFNSYCLIFDKFKIHFKNYNNEDCIGIFINKDGVKDELKKILISIENNLGVIGDEGWSDIYITK